MRLNQKTQNTIFLKKILTIKFKIMSKSKTTKVKKTSKGKHVGTRPPKPPKN